MSLKSIYKSFLGLVAIVMLFDIVIPFLVGQVGGFTPSWTTWPDVILVLSSIAMIIAALMTPNKIGWIAPTTILLMEVLIGFINPPSFGNYNLGADVISYVIPALSIVIAGYFYLRADRDFAPEKVAQRS